MQYSSLRAAYGVSGFEESSGAVPLRSSPPIASFQPLESKPPQHERDWSSAPQPMLSSAAPSIVPSAAPSAPPYSPSPMPSYSPSPMPSPVPASAVASLAPEAAYRFPVPVPNPIYGYRPNVHPSAAQNLDYDYFGPGSDSFCALCKQRNDREMKMMVIYIASGVFLLLFLDTIVRVAIHLAKKR
jgi:hypothetical protein